MGNYAYVGLMEVIFLSSLLFTHSLLMNSPVGWIYFRPLGAVSSIDRSAMVLEELNDLRKTCSNLIFGGGVDIGPEG